MEGILKAKVMEKKRAKVGVTTERELPLPSHMYKVTTWWGGKIEQVNPGQAIVMK